MSKSETTKWRVEVDREVDGRWIAEITSVPGAMAYGSTEGEAVQNVIKIAEAISGN